MGTQKFNIVLIYAHLIYQSDVWKATQYLGGSTSSVHNFLQDSHTQCGRVLPIAYRSEFARGQLYLAATTKMTIFMIRRHWHNGFSVVLVSRCDTTTRGLFRVSSAARLKMSTYAERPPNSRDITWTFSIEHTPATWASMNDSQVLQLFVFWPTYSMEHVAQVLFVQ